MEPRLVDRRRFLGAGGALGLGAIAFGSIAPRVGAQDSTPSIGGKLVVYSGRNEALVGPLMDLFREQSGIEVEVRYANNAELAATLLEEGENSPADVFFANDPGALGAIADEEMFASIPQDLLDRVDPRFRSDDGVWVGVSGRVTVLIYNTDLITEDQLPNSVLDLPTSDLVGQFGWAPPYASFQSFITAFRLLEGDDAARAWLEAMLDLEPVSFESNDAAARAVGEGEIATAFVNHYYLYEVQEEEEDEDEGGDDSDSTDATPASTDEHSGEASGPYPVANHYFADGDLGSIMLVSGAGILRTAPNTAQAEAFVDFLLSPVAQEYIAKHVWEYPMIEGVEPAEGLKPLDEIRGPEIDLSDLDDLEGTLEMLTDLGIL